MSSRTCPVVVTILSRNRTVFLTDTIESWLRQTRKPAKLVILDNASEPDTVAAIEDFADRGVILDRCPSIIGVAENFKRARRHASEAWLIVAHDDDIYHPNYLELVDKVISYTPYAPGVLVGTMLIDFTPTLEFGYSLRDAKLRRLDVAGLARELYSGAKVNFGATVYRRDVFNRIDPDWARYANLFDRPFLLACARDDGAALVDRPVVKYRVHRGQDVRNAAAALPAKYVCNLVRCYKGILRPNGWLAPDLFARRSLFLLWDSVRREARGLSGAFRSVRGAGVLSADEWIWGVLFFPWYFVRYRAAAWIRSIQEKFAS